MMPWDRAPPTMPHLPSATLGEVIAAYRRGRRQSHRDAPWSQEELAFASGTDQAHISRIESNRQIPSYSTLVRICDALALAQGERASILALAGYPIAPPLPDEDAVEAVLARLAPLVDSYPYPAVVLDEGERLWYLNAAVATVWGPCYGASGQRACLDLVRGRRVVELIFDPEPGRARLSSWREYYPDLEQVLERVLTIFWRARSVRPHDAELERVVSHLARNPEFVERSERVARGTSELTLVDHHAYVITNPRLGTLRLHAWRTRVSRDERFIVVHFTPTDSDTSQILARMNETPRRAKTEYGGMSVRHGRARRRVLP